MLSKVINTYLESVFKLALKFLKNMPIYKLLEKRNDIAHGNQKILDDNFITIEKIEEISNCIKVVLRQYKEDLFDIIENDKFLLETN